MPEGLQAGQVISRDIWFERGKAMGLVHHMGLNLLCDSQLVFLTNGDHEVNAVRQRSSGNVSAGSGIQR